MGKVKKEIEKIQIDENLSLSEVFKRYPHLETLQFLELKEENESSKIEKLNNCKKLLLD
tara:strand:+ start:1053 stop:1229 length:177 start_codon:yes stop_codon:yes gene_type:complete